MRTIQYGLVNSAMGRIPCSTERICCLYVCLSVCPIAYLIKHMSNFTKLSVHVTCGRESVRGSGDNAICHVLPVLWMTSCFHMTGQDQSDDVIFSGVHQVAAASRARRSSSRSSIALLFSVEFCRFNASVLLGNPSSRPPTATRGVLGNSALVSRCPWAISPAVRGSPSAKRFL